MPAFLVGYELILILEREVTWFRTAMGSRDLCDITPLAFCAKIKGGWIQPSLFYRDLEI